MNNAIPQFRSQLLEMLHVTVHSAMLLEEFLSDLMNFFDDWVLGHD